MQQRDTERRIYRQHACPNHPTAARSSESHSAAKQRQYAQSPPYPAAAEATATAALPSARAATAKAACSKTGKR